VDVPSDARNTRLHLLFERVKNDNPAPPSVGLDDVQLLPVLSSVSLYKAGDLEAFVDVPSKAELERVSLGHLRRYSPEEKDDTADDNSWERVHVTVALMGASAALDRCTYDVQFLYAEEDRVEKKLPIGCVMEASSASVRGVWAQCMLELPAIEVGDVRLLVRVSPQSIEEKCVLQPADSVLVFFNANTALYECAADAFLAGGSAMAEEHWPRGQCTPCRGVRTPGKPPPGLARSLKEEAAMCGRGSIMQGCPALTGNNLSCTTCNEIEVDEGRAAFDDVGSPQAPLEGAEPCKW
jgi:hypothetical protein